MGDLLYKGQEARRDMIPKRRVVIVEDDSSIAELIEYNLLGEGYDVLAFKSGPDMISNADRFSEACLFILDIMLPGMDGFEICKWIRESEAFSITPIIMLTARATEADKVRALTLGADDYITKPFGIREFLARVFAQIRRYESAGGTPTSEEKRPIGAKIPNAPEKARPPEEKLNEERKIFTSGKLTLDDTRHRVFLWDREIEMTNREYELLKHLMSHRGVAFSRDDLLNSVWGYEYIGETRTVDVHIRQIRKKIEKDSDHSGYIETVRGRGYRFRE